MKGVIKAHPLMLFDLIKPFGFVFVFPFIRATVIFLCSKKVSGVFLWETVAFLILLFFAEIRRRSISVELLDNGILLKSGVYFKNQSIIKRGDVASVYLKSNPIEGFLSVKTVYINTEAGKTNKPDFKIKLACSDAEELLGFLTAKKLQKRVGYSVFRVAFWAAAASSSLSGLLIGAPSFHRAARLFGVGIYETFLNGAERLGDLLGRYVPTFINAITVFLIFIYFIAFLYQLLKNLFFCVFSNGTAIAFKSGVIVKRQTFIFKRNVRGVIAEQGLLMRVFGRFSLKAAVGGRGGKYGGNALMAPALKPQELMAAVETALSVDKTRQNEIKTVRLRFGRLSAVLMPLVLGGLLILVAGVLLYAFWEFNRLIVFACFFLLAVLAVYGDVLLYSYTKGRVLLGKSVSVEGTIALRRRRFYFNKENIGEIKLRENPFDRRRGSCRARISLFSKSGQGATLRWLDKARLVSSVLSCYE